MWSRICLTFRSTWLHTRFLVGFVLLDVNHSMFILFLLVRVHIVCPSIYGLWLLFGIYKLVFLTSYLWWPVARHSIFYTWPSKLLPKCSQAFFLIKFVNINLLVMIVTWILLNVQVILTTSTSSIYHEFSVELGMAFLIMCVGCRYFHLLAELRRSRTLLVIWWMLSGRPAVNLFVSAQYLKNEMSDLNETWYTHA